MTQYQLRTWVSTWLTLACRQRLWTSATINWVMWCFFGKIMGCAASWGSSARSNHPPTRNTPSWSTIGARGFRRLCLLTSLPPIKSFISLGYLSSCACFTHSFPALSISRGVNISPLLVTTPKGLPCFFTLANNVPANRLTHAVTLLSRFQLVYFSGFINGCETSNAKVIFGLTISARHSSVRSSRTAHFPWGQSSSCSYRNRGPLKPAMLTCQQLCV